MAAAPSRLLGPRFRGGNEWGINPSIVPAESLRCGNLPGLGCREGLESGSGREQWRSGSFPAGSGGWPIMGS